ncbi:flagellar biosynthesis protein FliQ [Konateibacter massiliensis]|uniref:flagellar biosynthesis protein FliQ n=1 Tax=Konateibacter massiliensis TaxID=2002841 RepID=UPI002F421C37
MITSEIVIDIAKDTVYTIIISSAPLLLVSLIVGLVISIVQTATSIQEQTLTFVPKIICIFLAIMVFGGWILNNIVEFMIRLWSNFSIYVG